MSTPGPFPLVEAAMRELIETAYPEVDGKTGGSPSYVYGQGVYIMISLVPGAGRTDLLEGEWAVDVDVFSDRYGVSMGHALALEPLLIGPRKTTSLLLLDNVYQNETPAERPWDDERVARVGATYVFTARRPSDG